MRRGLWFKLTAALLIYANLLPPALLLAQTSKPAGVVSALKGEVVITRVALPQQPVPLKFKDEVFFRDRITTKEQSLVRVLMGGKALITVRELSELTITEEPGKPSLVDLARGKIGLAVARAKMSPGESIEVRTPNAVAAVRGTVIIVEVLPAGAAPGSAEAEPNYRPVRASFTGEATPVQAPSFITNFHVLKGSIDVLSIGQPGAAPVNIGAGLSVAITGTTIGQPRPSPPAQQLVKDLKSDPQHTDTPDETKETIATNSMNTATTLGDFLIGKPPIIDPPIQPKPEPINDPCTLDPDGPGCKEFTTPPPSDPCLVNPASCTPPPPPTPATGEPLVTFTGFGPATLTLNAPLGLVQSGEGTVAPTPLSFVSPDPIGPEVTVSPIGEGQTPGQILTPGSPGEITTPYFATSAPGGTVVLSGGIGLTDTTVSAGVNTVFSVNGAQAILEGSALALTNSSITGTGTVLNIFESGLTGTSSLALIALDSASSINTFRLVTVDGESADSGLVLVGPALAAADSTVNATNNLILIGSMGFLGVASALPLVALDNSTIQASSLLNVNFGTAELGGSLLLAQNDSSIQINGTGVSVFGGTLNATSSLPLIALTNSHATFSGSVLADGEGADVTLAGALLSVSGRPTPAATSVSANGIVDIFDSSGSLTVGGSILSVTNAALAPGVTDVAINSTAVNVNDGSLAMSASPVIFLQASRLSAPLLLNLTGSATGSEVVQGVTLTLGTDRPLHGSGTCPSCPLQATLLSASASSISANQLLRLDTALLETVAPLVDLLNSPETLVSASDLVHLVSQAKLVGTVSGDALVKLDGSTLGVTSGALFNVAGGSFLHVPSGSLFSLTNSSTLNILSGPLVTVSGGSVFKLENGSLGTFGTGTNTLSFSGAPACSSGTCVQILSTDFNILLLNGAVVTDVVIFPAFEPFAGLGGTNTVMGLDPEGELALIVVDGVGNRLVLGAPGAGNAPLVTIDASTFTLTSHLGLVNTSEPTTAPAAQAYTGLSGTQGTLYLAQDGKGAGVALSGGIGLTDSNIDAAGFDAFRVDGVATIDGSALTLTSSSITNAGTILFVNALGGLTGLSTAPLISLASSSSLDANTLVRVDGTLTLVGPLLSATDSTLVLGGSVVSLPSGTPSVTITGGDVLNVTSSTVTGSGTGVGFISIAAGTLSASGALVNLGAGAALNFVGPVTDPILKLSGGTVMAGSGLILAAGAALLPTSAAGGATITVGFTPFDIALTPDGTKAYVPNFSSNTVSVINTADNSVTTVSVGSLPFAVAVSADGSRAYVTNLSSATVSVINTADNSVATVTGLGTTPLALAVRPDGNRLYVANFNSANVSVIDTDPLSPTVNMVIATVPVGSSPQGIAVTPDGSKAFVVNQNSSTVSVITTADNSVATVAVSADDGEGSASVAITPDGTKAYVTNRSSNVSVINTADNSVTPVPVGPGIQVVAVTPDGAKAYVANGDSGTVSVIETATDTVIATVAVGSSPRSIAFTPDGSRAYVVNQSSSTVSVINTADDTVIATVATGSSPLDVVVSSDGTQAYVVNQSSGTVSVIDRLELPLFQVTGGSLTLTGSLLNVPALAAFNLSTSLLTVSGSGSVESSADLITVGGSLILGSSSALVSVSGTGTLTTVGATSDLVSVSAGGSLSLSGSLLSVDGEGAAVIGGGGLVLDQAALYVGEGGGGGGGGVGQSLFSMNGGSLTIGGVGLVATNSVVYVDNGSAGLLNIAGGSGASLGNSLLTATGSRISFESSLVMVTGTGSSLTGTSTQPLVSLSSSVFYAESLVEFPCCPATSTVSLAGPVLSATDSLVTFGGSNGIITVCCTGASFSSTTGLPLVSLLNSPLGTDGGVLDLDSNTSFSLQGGLLSATGSPVFLDGKVLDFCCGGHTFTQTVSSAPLVTLQQSPLILDTDRFWSLDDGTYSLTGPVLSATDSPVRSGSTFFDACCGPMSLTSTSGDPFITLTRSPLRASSQFFRVQDSLTMSLGGPLLAATDSPLLVSSQFLDLCCNGTSLTTTVNQPLFSLDRSPLLVDSQIIDLSDATMSLGGPLLTATDSPIIGRSEFIETTCCSVVSALSSTSPDPLISLTRSPFLLSGEVFELEPATTVSLAGPLFSATDSPILTDNQFIEMSFSGGSLLSGTSSQPLISLTGSALMTSNEVIHVRATVTLQGSLSSVTDSLISSPSDYLRYQNATLTNTGTQPLFSASGSLLFIDEQFLDLGSTINLADKFLAATDSVLTVNADFLLAIAGGHLNSTGAVPLVTLDGTTLTAPTVLGVPTALALARVQGGGSIEPDPDGSLLIATDSTLSLSGALLRVESSGLFDTGGSAEDLVTISGGSHAAGYLSGAGLFNLTGSGLPAQPLIHAGRLLVLDGASLLTSQGVRLDRALLEVSAPLFDLAGASILRSSNDLVKLVQNAQLTGMVAGDALIKLASSRLTVHNGSLFTVANAGGGASTLNVTGSLVSLTNGATLDILNGALVTVSGGSTFTLTGGSLAVFGSTGTNTLNIANTSLVCAGNCVSLNGDFQALLLNGAVVGDVTVDPGFVPFTGTGTVNVNGATSGTRVVMVVDGVGNTINLGPSGSVTLPTGTTVAFPSGSGPAVGDPPIVTFADSLLTLTGPLGQVQLTGEDVDATPASFPVVLGNPGSPYVAQDDGSAPPVSLSGGISLTRTAVTGSGGPIFQVSANATIDGSLLVLVDSSLDTRGGAVLSVTSGSLTGTSAAPLIFADPSSITASNVVSMASGTTLSLAGALFRAVDTTVYTSSSFMTLASGAQVTGTGTDPFVSFSRSLAGTNVVQFDGSFLKMDPTSTSLSLAGPLLSAAGTTLSASDDFIKASLGSAALSSTGSGSLTSFTNSTLAVTGSFLDLVKPGATVTLGGPLFEAVDSTLTTGDVFITLGNGATFDGEGTDPLVEITRTLSGRNMIAFGNNFSGGLLEMRYIVCCAPDPAPTMTLAGPLLSVSDSLVTSSGNLLRLDDGATLTSTTPNPLMAFTDSMVTVDGTVLGLYDEGATVALQGSLLALTDSTLAVDGDLINTCCGILITTTGTSAPLFSFTNSVVVLDGSVIDICCDDISPATMTLSGPLLTMSGGSLTMQEDLLGICCGAQVSSTSTAPFLSFTNTQVAIDGLLMDLCCTDTQPARLALAGPLLSVSGGSVTVERGLISVCCGNADPDFVQLTRSGTQPLISLMNTTVTVGDTFLELCCESEIVLTGTGNLLTATNSTLVLGQSLLEMCCTNRLTSGTNGALITFDQTAVTAHGSLLALFLDDQVTSLAGPLLSATDGTLAVGGSLVEVEANDPAGGLVTSSSASLVSLTGGSHAVGLLDDGEGGFALFNLSGSNTAVEVVEGNTLTLGTDRPIQHGGVLLETSGAAVNTPKAIRIDRALLEATAPLIHMMAASTMTSNSDLVNLASQAKLFGNLLPGDALVKLNNSILNVNGSLFNVAGGSYLNVVGNLVSLTGGSTLNITNGALVALTGGSVFTLTGSFGSFGTGTNTINLPTSLGGYTVNTSLVPGFGVALGSGVLPSQVTVTNFTPFTGTGSVTTGGIVVKVADTTSKVRLCTSGC